MTFEPGERVRQDRATGRAAWLMAHALQLVVDRVSRGTAAALDLRSAIRLRELPRERELVGRKEVHAEHVRLLNVGERVSIVLYRHGDEPWIEGDLHDPVGHHAVWASVRSRADDVESIGHLCKGTRCAVTMDGGRCLEPCFAGHGLPPAREGIKFAIS